MDPIEELTRRLSRLPDARYESEPSFLTVFPNTQDGFMVTITKNSSDSYTVFFNGWHEDFESPEEASNVFALGLSDECRLREYRRGEFAYKWTVESLEEGKWEEQSTTGLFIFPFWRTRRLHYLQNKLLSQNKDPFTAGD